MTTTLNKIDQLISEEGNDTSQINNPQSAQAANAFMELEKTLYKVLETYSNVHRGSGHFSQVSTHLYEQAREIVLDYLNLDKKVYTTIFASPARTDELIKKIKPSSYKLLSSKETGIRLGINALAVKKNAFPKGVPLESGGGTTRMIGQNWAVWASAPDKFEAGTPAVVNAIGLAKTLLLIKEYGKDVFKSTPEKKISTQEIIYQDDLSAYKGIELLNRLRQKIIQYKNGIPTSQGKLPYINLDNSASTPTFEPIWEAFRKTIQQPVEIQQEIVEEVRKISADMFHAPIKEYEFIFTSNTTEAINLAARNLAKEELNGIEPVVLNTLMEHSSNDLPWRMVTKDSLVRLPVDDKGFIDINELKRILSEYNQQHLFGNKRIKLVAVSGASNVLGSCNDIATLCNIAHKYDARVMLDAAQLIAHRKVDISGWNVDYLAFSAHKVYAPFGTGMLIAKKELLNFNKEEMEGIHASGHSNPGGIAALGKALNMLQRIGMVTIQDEEKELTKQLLEGMKGIPSIRIFGVQSSVDDRFSDKLGVVSFNFPAMMADRTANRLVRNGGIGVRFGCHCAHLIVKHILGVKSGLENFQRIIAVLFRSVQFPGMVRVSLGLQNTSEDIEKFLTTLKHISEKEIRVVKTQKPIPTGEVKKQMQDFVDNISLAVYE